jgi:hypothetical protein
LRVALGDYLVATLHDLPSANGEFTLSAHFCLNDQTILTWLLIPVNHFFGILFGIGRELTGPGQSAFTRPPLLYPSTLLTGSIHDELLALYDSIAGHPHSGKRLPGQTKHLPAVQAKKMGMVAWTTGVLRCASAVAPRSVDPDTQGWN